MRKFLVLSVMMVLFGLVLLAVVPLLLPSYVPPTAELVIDVTAWPQWRGPMRNGVAPDGTGIRCFDLRKPDTVAAGTDSEKPAQQR